MKSTKILGIDIVSQTKKETMEEIIRQFENIRGRCIYFINTHALVIVSEDKQFKQAQNNSFMSLPDGAPVSKIIKKKGYPLSEKYSGPDFLVDFLAICSQQDWGILVYGNTETNCRTFKQKAESEHSNLRIDYIPSKFRELTQEEENLIVTHINDNKYDVVLVSLGCPRQELFCFALAKNTSSLWIAVGGAINVYSGAIQRAPKWMQNHSLEWLFRLYKEPRRLFKRYLIYNTKFLYYRLIGKI